jgi:hypothetical protein
MKVKIVKASDDAYWYARLIGKIFEVYSSPQAVFPEEENSMKYYMCTENNKLYININDVEVIATPLYYDSSDNVE